MKPFLINSQLITRLLGKRYFGLDDLDQNILKYVNHRNGFYVELGANDGVKQSNTKHLELYKNWKGILIEPSARQFRNLTKFRKKSNYFFNCACVASDFPKKTIQIMYSNLMSTPLEGRNDIADPRNHAKLGERHSEREKSFVFEVEARTLQSIFYEVGAPAVIDFMSLDVEGGELEVLNGIDFKKTNFDFILIETRSFEKICNFFETVNYKFVAQMSHHDFLFTWNESKHTKIFQ
jgi:FkbM family methyltransferase